MPMPMKTKIVANGKIDANADADNEVRHRHWTKISFTYCSVGKIISCM